MPTSMSAREGWSQYAPASAASARRAEGTSTWATRTSRSGSPSVTTSAAPRPTASGMKRRASCLKPGTATNAWPRSTRRESAERPVTDGAGAGDDLDRHRVARRHLQVAEHRSRDRREDRRRRFAAPLLVLRLVEQDEQDEPRLVRRHEADERQHARRA